MESVTDSTSQSGGDPLEAMLQQAYRDRITFLRGEAGRIARLHLLEESGVDIDEEEPELSPDTVVDLPDIGEPILKWQ